MEAKLKTYNIINRYFQNFLDHVSITFYLNTNCEHFFDHKGKQRTCEVVKISLQNMNRINYVIVEKTLKEKLLQTEIQSYRDIGYFYAGLLKFICCAKCLL